MHSGSAWHKDHTACAGTGLCDDGWSLRQAASQHPGRPPADLWLLVCNMEAGESLYTVQTRNAPLQVTKPANVSVGMMSMPWLPQALHVYPRSSKSCGCLLPIRQVVTHEGLMLAVYSVHVCDAPNRQCICHINSKEECCTMNNKLYVVGHDIVSERQCHCPVISILPRHVGCSQCHCS